MAQPRFSGDPSFYESKQYETYESMEQRTKLVCDAMQQDILSERIELPTKMLLIPRGSYFVADIATRVMDIGSIDNLFFAAKSYDDETRKSGRLRIGQAPTRKLIEGENVLIVDEVCETGRTLKAAHRHADRLGASTVVSMVVHYKPKRTLTGYVPDYYAEMTDNWIEYPSEQIDELGVDFNKRLVDAGLRSPVQEDM